MFLRLSRNIRHYSRTNYRLSRRTTLVSAFSVLRESCPSLPLNILSGRKQHVFEISFFPPPSSTVHRIGIHTALTTRRPAVMAVAKHHNPLAEDASGRVTGADPRMKEWRTAFHEMNDIRLYGRYIRLRKLIQFLRHLCQFTMKI